MRFIGRLGFAVVSGFFGAMLRVVGNLLTQLAALTGVRCGGGRLTLRGRRLTLRGRRLILRGRWLTLCGRWLILRG